ncbi:MAG: hypothetical protein M1816_004679 [Peltula sp. TS41687]|nr:MAG: hypothetical protein M1816_004679 [Peltula sp. TS41687]
MPMMPEMPKLYRDTDPRTKQSLEEMVAQITRQYPIEMLHDLRKALPCLVCDLNKFTADAWRSQLIKPPISVNELVIFPADFPKITRRKRSQIPDQRIRADVNEKTSKGKGTHHSAIKIEKGKGKPLLPPLTFPPPPTSQHGGFEQFLETVPSPTDKRVTAGGRIVPAEPGSVSPVASKSTTYVPPHMAAIEASPVLVQSSPGMPPVLYQPIGSVAPLASPPYSLPTPAETMSANSPPMSNVLVPVQEQQPLHAAESNKVAANNIVNPLKDVTNRPKVLYPEYELDRRLALLQAYADHVYGDMERSSGVDDHRFKLGNLEYEIVLEEIDKLSAAVSESKQKRSVALREQATRARLNRTKGIDPNGEMVRQNFEWWTDSNLMTDSGQFLSHAQSLHPGPLTAAEVNEVQQYLDKTALENHAWRSGNIVQESSARNITNEVPQSSFGGWNNFGGSPYSGVNRGRTLKRLYAFGLDGGADSDDGETDQPASEENLRTELQSPPGMTSTSSRYGKVPAQTEMDDLYGQLGRFDPYQKSDFQTEAEGSVVMPSLTEIVATRGKTHNTLTENSAQSVSTDLINNLHLTDPENYMRTFDSHGIIKTILRTPAAEAHLLHLKNNLKMKLSSAEYRNLLKEDHLKNPKTQQAYIADMMRKNPQLASSSLTAKKFGELLEAEFQKRREHAKVLLALIEEVEPSIQPNFYEQPQTELDAAWGVEAPPKISKKGALIDYGSSDEDDKEKKKNASGSAGKLEDDDEDDAPETKKKGKALILDHSDSDDDETDLPDPDEVDEFFDRLRRQEEEEIAKYRAENPL